MLHTNLALLRRSGACPTGYRKLVKYLGGSRQYGIETPIPLDIVLESNNLEDALWCLRAVLPEQQQSGDRLSQLLACDYAEHVLPIWEAAYPTDMRVRNYIDTVRRYNRAEASVEELNIARENVETADEAGTAVAAWAVARAVERTEAVARTDHDEKAWQAERFLAYLNGEEATSPVETWPWLVLTSEGPLQ